MTEIDGKQELDPEFTTLSGEEAEKAAQDVNVTKIMEKYDKESVFRVLPGFWKMTSRPYRPRIVPWTLDGPYRTTSIIPVTTVGTAKGRSIRALTSPLPGKG